MHSEAGAADGLQSLAELKGISAQQLLPALYDSLRRIAHRQLQGERAGHSLNTTALVHETWMRLIASYPDLQFGTDREFLALSGHLMRRVLTDHARALHRLKRRGPLGDLTYTDGLRSPAAEVESDELLALDIALTRLHALDPRQVAVVELRYFSGFSIEETAELMDLSPATVKREWAMARAWLRAHLQDPR